MLQGYLRITVNSEIYLRVLYSRNIANRIIKPCRDPGIFARGPRPDSQKTALTPFFFGLILQFYRGCPMVISKKTIIFQGFRGGQLFPRGGGGPNANFYRSPYNL